MISKKPSVTGRQLGQSFSQVRDMVLLFLLPCSGNKTLGGSLHFSPVLLQKTPGSGQRCWQTQTV